MISTPHAREALKKARPRSKMMYLVLAPLRMGNITLTMTESEFISWVRQNSTSLFARLKNKTVIKSSQDDSFFFLRPNMITTKAHQQERFMKPGNSLQSAAFC